MKLNNYELLVLSVLHSALQEAASEFKRKKKNISLLKGVYSLVPRVFEHIGAKSSDDLIARITGNKDAYKALRWCLDRYINEFNREETIIYKDNRGEKYVALSPYLKEDGNYVYSDYY